MYEHIFGTMVRYAYYHATSTHTTFNLDNRRGTRMTFGRLILQIPREDANEIRT